MKKWIAIAVACTALCGVVYQLVWPIAWVTLHLGRRDVGFWAAVLNGENSKLHRIVALEMLKGLYPNNKAEASEALATALTHDSDNQIRQSAAFFFRSIGPEATPMVPAIAEAVRDEDELVRIEAIAVLEGLGSDAKIAIPRLVEAATDSEPRVRDAAKRALAKIDPEFATKTGFK